MAPIDELFRAVRLRDQSRIGQLIERCEGWGVETPPRVAAYGKVVYGAPYSHHHLLGDEVVTVRRLPWGLVVRRGMMSRGLVEFEAPRYKIGPFVFKAGASTTAKIKTTYLDEELRITHVDGRPVVLKTIPSHDAWREVCAVQPLDSDDAAIILALVSCLLAVLRVLKGIPSLLVILAPFLLAIRLFTLSDSPPASANATGTPFLSTSVAPNNNKDD